MATHMDRELTIIGAGPAGLVAAITAAKAGLKATVYEIRSDVGGRFNNDFEGLENWSTKDNILDQFRKMGIDINFECVPNYSVVHYDAFGNEYISKSDLPNFYLLRRGRDEGTLDYSLKKQAESLGVNIQYEHTLEQLPNGGIVCIGPRSPDGIAVGYLFETDIADGAYSVFDDRLAPKAYAYLLVNKNRATLATCLYEDFHNEKVYLERTVDFFQKKLNFTMKNPRRFGGAGNFVYPKTAVKNNILYAGECAGFQDPLWGFGIRYAVISGYLAAQNFIQQLPPAHYDKAWKKAFGGNLKAALVNRYMCNKAGNDGYQKYLRRAIKAPSSREWMYTVYSPSLYKTLIYYYMRTQIEYHRDADYAMKNCLCTWCRLNHA